MNVTYLLFGAAILAVLAAAVLFGYYVVSMRGRQPEKTSPANAARRLAAPAPQQPSGHTDGLSTAHANLPDASYEEEEMPTVVVARPPKAEQRRRPAPARSSGATIIAFDDDEDDDSH